ncbi:MULTISPECIES: TetR/AcrR family transcriptional regulator [Nocardia]|jgi:AcrR family transcriptional regulator|uniref:TetR/AcrR family transcriptional regulator n=1 Tax=Nocardia nova TaxID=37330 RepID=A0A2S6A802_9NOCA|nr:MULTISPECIES: TetR/AcrR family transcriptional regulator [Nocardia]OBF65248.1 TetR family transcriptional regulator [Mycobacterium sp. 852002-51759_SCH5129042]MBF6274489.1 TetR/AcrR family transcriptional regulator [Nocardia nova]MBV7705039.1 TetR/AcrR family transcriptional regulator [Nocardia nova]OBA49170.1 TetR family transcriptional regulator [Nocardia sp. 852002-51101_SCH5132738]OBB42207.1 TetR family transcriptional regulator [Nocardia sp. 852002-51244_SCH5132740]
MSPRRAAALHDRDDRDLRAHLIATAEKLFAEQGSAGLTVRAIARAAGVSDGVLYNHFADKEELLAAALRAHVESVDRSFPPLPAAGSGDLAENLAVCLRQGLALHQAVLPVFAGLITQPAVLARFAETEGRQRIWREELVVYLRAERDLGRLAADADVDAAAAVLVGICHDAVLSSLLSGTPRPFAPPPVAAVVATLLSGIAVR